ncbi:MAG: hypothetical protein ACR2O4_11000 [Hyphomicrobiaceae bacterium]
MAQSAWKRFPVPEFDYRSLKGLTYAPPKAISSDDASRIVEAANASDASAAGGYAVEPDPALLERLSFAGDVRQMILCALPGDDRHLLARSNAWFNQQVFVLDANAEKGEILFDWQTPRPNNTRLGPEDGVALDRSVIYLLSGRVLDDHTRGNRLIIDADWDPGDGRQGFRVLAGCDEGEDNFHDSYFELSWKG